MRVARAILVTPIRLYQRLISPALGQRCKYYPSCSEYAVQAIRTFGILRGSVLAFWRLLRCNPWSRGGFDPIEDQRLFKPPTSAAGATNGYSIRITNPNPTAVTLSSITDTLPVGFTYISNSTSGVTSVPHR